MDLTIGIDIGTKNYAICAIEYTSVDKWSIIKYAICDIRSDPIVQLSSELTKFLVDFTDRKAVFVIEDQPGKQKIMERILGATIMYIVCNRKNDKYLLMKAKDKFKVCAGITIPKGKTSYRDRKKLSIRLGSDCIKKNKSLDAFHNQKLDDLYDSLLMCLSFNGHRLTV
jgi:hypothetical protein